MGPILRRNPSQQGKRGDKNVRRLVTWQPQSGSRERWTLMLRFLSPLYTDIFLICVCLCICVWVCEHEFRGSQRPGVSDTLRAELFNMGSES